MRQLWQRVAVVGAILIAGTIGVLAGAASTQKSKTYYWMVYTNPAPGRKAEYLEWYMGKHIHELLGLEGMESAQFFELSDTQFASDTQPQHYMMIWETKTDNMARFFDSVKTQVFEKAPADQGKLFGPDARGATFTPVSRRVTRADVQGKTDAQVLAFSRLP